MLETADLRQSGLRPWLLARLGLYSELLDEVRPRSGPAALQAAVGVAQVATGRPDAALEWLVAGVRGRSDWGWWLRAAVALAQLDPARLRREIQGREGEPPAALLLAHLAERAGDPGRAEALVAAIRSPAQRAEADLLAANIARRRGDRSEAEAAIARAFERFGLRAPTEPAVARRDSGPMVTVIVAAFNAGATIHDALASLCAQSWRQLEIVLVDDASRDDTVAVAEALAARTGRLRILRLNCNGGAYAARNAGALAARGDFVTVHDADDTAHPQRIERQVMPLLRDARLVATTARLLRRRPDGRLNDRQIVPLLRLHVGSALIRLPFFKAALGGYDEVRYGADGDLLARLDVAAGACGVRRLALPLTIAAFDPASAVHAPDTGYGDRGYSRLRQDYHESSLRRVIAGLLQ